MDAVLTPLLPLYERERAAGRALALAVVAHTSGSTYRKPGALMAIAADGAYAGLLSGGCLESDLREHARAVIETGQAHLVTYNTGGSDDLLWGLGLGCEGAMQILLLRVGPANDWQPLSHLAGALLTHRATAIAITVESVSPELPPGTVLLPGGGGCAVPPVPGAGDSPAPQLLADVNQLLRRATETGRTAWLPGTSQTKVLAVPLALPPRLLLLGGGPDALPIVELAARLGWKVTVFDHRPSYAQAAQFPGATQVVLARPEELPDRLDLGSFEAAVVMSHHLPSDLAYLRCLCSSDIGYVGLLGPAIRRERLLADLGTEAPAISGRLRAPVGLDLGGRAPESIALSIVAEIHAFLYGRAGASFSLSRSAAPVTAPA